MNVNVDKLIEFNLPLDGFFILYCLHNEETGMLQNYVTNISKIPTKVFKQLISEGWLETTAKDDTFTLTNISVTDRFSKEILGIVDVNGITFAESFEQLREHYPSKAGRTERRLQGNVARCKTLYQNTITKNGVVDEELHSLILQCINYEIKSRTKDRSLDYFQMLATWLQQRTWEVYKQDVEEEIKKNGFVDKKEDLGGFTTDI